MKVEIEFVLRCAKCLNLLEAKQNYQGSKTLYTVEPCENCIKEKSLEAKSKKNAAKSCVVA